MWVRVGDVGDVGECKRSEDVEDCDWFYLEPDCSGGISYDANGSSKCLIYFILLFYFW
jgi:hypothetical protein